MSIQPITTDQLRRMGNQEGLILQGCGGDLQEWVDGINEILTEEEVLKKGTRFEEAYTFEHDGLTCLLFPFKKGMEIETGRLAMWRLQTHPAFGGTWLSDYVPNRLGGFLPKEPTMSQQKPDCGLIGEDGNAFNLVGKAAWTLRQHGMKEQAEELCQRFPKCDSYNAVLNLIGEYVNITDSGQAVEKQDWDMEMY